MIRIKIADIAKTKGLENAYGLQNALKCSPTMASKLWKGTFKQIGIETVDRLCNLFDCEPSDFIVYDSGKPKVEKPRREPQINIETEMGGIWLNTKQVAERLGVSPRTVIDYIRQERLPATKGKQGHNFTRESDVEEFIKNRNISP